eukprot:NODE_67_length_23829_cov_0.557059.p6 type:complete len:371 gc:universal NODE_67_length_23829_cov_0.557059:18756-19868(+)
MKHFSNIIVGSGPASIALIGKLLDKNIKNICWVDPTWTGGRLSQYSLVPSNTKVKLFTQFGKVCNSFSNINSQSREKMETLDPDSGCVLQYPCEMVVEYANELIAKFGIYKYVGCVAGINKMDDGFQVDLTQDSIDLDSSAPFYGCSVSDSFSCDAIYLTTGSKPLVPSNGAHTYNPEAQILPLDISLDPLKLAHRIPPNSKIAVIGNSHSAILVLRNLSQIQCNVTCFYRRPIKYAIYEDGWIRFDNTGLKGEAALWAKNELPKTKNVKMIQLLNDEKQFLQHMPEIDFVVYAIGYVPRSLPIIKINSRVVYNIKHDNSNGQIYSNDVKIDNLYGFGVAFPEQVTDRVGNVEMSVGMWKFMNYMNKVFG